MHDQKAETMTKTLFDGWISRFRAPDFITMDQVRNFDGHLLKAFTQFLGTYRTRTTTYHSQANSRISLSSLQWVDKYKLAWELNNGELTTRPEHLLMLLSVQGLGPHGLLHH
ncbi:hypothetical protein TNCV_4821371 [Trichonephila clavipes]|nr:hypothetical protein TNCV_4821371 [Trichonephila clavipes]